MNLKVRFEAFGCIEDSFTIDFSGKKRIDLLVNLEVLPAIRIVAAVGGLISVSAEPVQSSFSSFFTLPSRGVQVARDWKQRIFEAKSK